MESIENLFYQIFNRKDWIIDQLKHQQHSYDQSIASSLLINQICPPSWLFNNTANHRELKKEELISDLLFPPQKATVTSSVGCCPLYGGMLVKGDNTQLSESFFTETCASNRYLYVENRLPEVSKSHLSKNEVGQKNFIKEVSATDSLDAFHQAQEDPEEVEGCFELDHSLARIQKSRSRQKAMELCNSEKSKSKNCPSNVAISKEFTSRITRSRASLQQSSCLRESPKAMEHGEGDKEIHILRETNFTSRSSTAQNLRCVDESLGMVKSSNQRDAKCPHEPAGILATETISNAPEEAKYVNCGSNPNFIDPQLGLTLEVNSRHLNSCCKMQKSESQASERKTSRRRESDPTKADIYDVFEPKQLVFDDIEECDKLKPTQSSQIEDITEDFQRKDDGSEGNLLWEKTEQRQSLEGVDRVLLKGDKGAAVFSNEACAGSERKAQIEEEFDLVETDILSETGAAILEVDLNPEIPDEKSVGNRDLGASVCECCGEANAVLGNSQLASSGTCLNVSDARPGSDSSFPCLGKLDMHLEVQDMEIPESASDSAGRSIFKEILTLDAAEVCSSGGEAMHFLSSHSSDNDNKNIDFSNEAGGKNVLEETRSPEIAQICSAGGEAPYFLRSRSTSRDRNADFAESSGCHNIGNSSQSAKISLAFSEIFSEGRKGPYIPRNHSIGPDKNVGSANLNGSHDACEASWPPFKRRKINNQPNLAFATLLKIRRVKSVLQIPDDNVCTHLRSLEDYVEVHDEQLNMVAEHPEVEIDQSMDHRKKEASKSPPKLQLLSSPFLDKEGTCNSKREVQARMTQVLFKQMCMESSIDNGLKKQVDGKIEFIFGNDDEESSSVLDMGRWSTPEIGLNTHCFTSKLELENVFVPSDRIEDSDERRIADKKSQHGDKSSYDSVKLANYESLDYGNRNLYMLRFDETVLEFEDFSIDASTKTTEPFLVGNGLTLKNSDLQSIMETQACALQCKSSITTPLPSSSIEYRIHTEPDVHRSLPNLLEHIKMENSLPYGNEKLVASKSLDRTDVFCNLGAQKNVSLLGRFKSDSISSSSVQSEWDIKKPAKDTPPIGKFSGRRILKSTSSSSEKQLSRIPEFTCFRIEEDTITCEENIRLDDNLESSQKGISSKEKRISANRDALADATSHYSNPAASISQAGKFSDRSSVDSVDAGTQMGCTAEDMENQNFSLAGAQKANGSLCKRLLTPKLSSNAVKRNGSHTFLEKGGKLNNIVSHVSSFLPFVQQRAQAPAVLTGKRDIKVKALEAAEAVKRLEEKKENERKARKEAAKIDRAKIEAENLRRMEMKQKQKVEERKKKEAELAAKKRRREEEEKKEKEKKRKCLEETRRKQQKEREDKLQAEREEKDQRRKALEEKERKKKELAEEAKELQWTEKSREEDGCRERMELETLNTRFSGLDSRKASSTHENRNALEKPGGTGKVNNNGHSSGMASEKNSSIIGGSEGSQSYEITPYKGSDNEEEDALTPKKVLPPWSRKENLIRDLCFQQKIDPDEMFFHAKCFSYTKFLELGSNGLGERRI